RAPCCRGGRGGGRARRRVGTEGRGVRRAAAGSAGDGGGDRGVLPSAARELQEARDRPLPARAAEEPARQGAAPRAAHGARVVRPPVAWLTLARPTDGNRLDADLLGDLAAAATAAEEDEAVRVVVLAAAGRAFSLGLPAGCRWPEPAWADGVGRVAALSKPVIAAVAGEARG